MQSAALPATEKERLATLHALDVLDTGPEEEFDALIRVASLVCGVPISLISLVDSERQWFKANIGLPGVSETPRDIAFCSHAILDDQLFEVPDALQDARFADNPLVTSAPDIRFYAGAPLCVDAGLRLGTLCAIDQRPRQLGPHEREQLRLGLTPPEIAVLLAYAKITLKETLLATSLPDAPELRKVSLTSFMSSSVSATSGERPIASRNARVRCAVSSMTRRSGKGFNAPSSSSSGRPALNGWPPEVMTVAADVPAGS